MKKIVFITVSLIVALFAIAEQHRQVDIARKEWKTEWLMSEGLTDKEYPEHCFYCDCIEPLIKKYHGQEKK